MENKKNIFSRNGMTFVEVMLVVAIIIIMSSIILASLSGTREEKRVEATARKVAAVLKEAQNGALTGKTIDSSHYPCIYNFVISAPNYIVQYEYHLEAETCDDPLQTAELARYNIEDSVSVSGPAVSFKVPHANVVSGADSQFTVSSGSHSYNVCVTQQGDVKAYEAGTDTCP